MARLERRSWSISSGLVGDKSVGLLWYTSLQNLGLSCCFSDSKKSKWVSRKEGVLLKNSLQPEI